MPRPRSWTDQDLANALGSARTMADVVRALRLARGGAAYTTVRSRMEQLGLALPRPEGGASGTGRGRRRGWTEGELCRAVAQATSLNEVFDRLHLAVGGSQWLVVRSLILERAWSTEHWARPLGRPSRGLSARDFGEAVARSDFADLVANSRSRAEIIRRLGHEPTSTTYRCLAAHLEECGVPVDHLEPGHAAMRRTDRPRYRMPLEAVLVEQSSYRSMATLKRRLVDEGVLVDRCALCRLDAWRGGRIVLHLDHVNGVRDDHRVENLRLLCPNCHSQTETYAGRNKGRYAWDLRRS